MGAPVLRLLGWSRYLAAVSAALLGWLRRGILGRCPPAEDFGEGAVERTGNLGVKTGVRRAYHNRSFGEQASQPDGALVNARRRGCIERHCVGGDEGRGVLRGIEKGKELYRLCTLVG